MKRIFPSVLPRYPRPFHHVKTALFKRRAAENPIWLRLPFRRRLPPIPMTWCPLLRFPRMLSLDWWARLSAARPLPRLRGARCLPVETSADRMTHHSNEGDIYAYLRNERGRETKGGLLT